MSRASLPTLRQLQDSLAEIEANLARSRRQLVEAQQLAQVGSWEWDIAGDVVWWSDELYRIYGLQPGAIEPTYEEFLTRVHPDDRASVDERNRRAFADHKPFEDIKRVMRADGREIQMRTQGEVICDDDGRPIRMVGICEDVTDEQAHPAALARQAALEIEGDVVQPLREAGALLARGELDGVAAAIEETQRRARRIAERMLGGTGSLAGQS